MSNVLKISEAASLALHSMALLAANEQRLLSTREIADTLGVSQAHLSKVLQELGRAELVVSTRGPRGGFRLAWPADEISLLEVYEAIDGPLQATTCLLGPPTCSGEECVMGNLLETVNRQVRDYLTQTMLSDVNGAYRGVEPGRDEEQGVAAHDT